MANLDLHVSSISWIFDKLTFTKNSIYRRYIKKKVSYQEIFSPPFEKPNSSEKCLCCFSESMQFFFCFNKNVVRFFFKFLSSVFDYLFHCWAECMGYDKFFLCHSTNWQWMHNGTYNRSQDYCSVKSSLKIGSNALTVWSS